MVHLGDSPLPNLLSVAPPTSAANALVVALVRVHQPRLLDALRPHRVAGRLAAEQALVSALLRVPTIRTVRTAAFRFSPPPGCFMRHPIFLALISPTSLLPPCHTSPPGCVQLGDVTTPLYLQGSNTTTTVTDFISSYLGFQYYMVGYVVLILSAFAILFFSLFAYALQRLNFQKR